MLRQAFVPRPFTVPRVTFHGWCSNSALRRYPMPLPLKPTTSPPRLASGATGERAHCWRSPSGAARFAISTGAALLLIALVASSSGVSPPLRFAATPASPTPRPPRRSRHARSRRSSSPTMARASCCRFARHARSMAARSAPSKPPSPRGPFRSPTSSAGPPLGTTVRVIEPHSSTIERLIQVVSVILVLTLLLAYALHHRGALGTNRFAPSPASRHLTLARCRRRARGAGRSARRHRLSQESRALPRHGRALPQGRAPRGPAGHGKNAPRARRRGRSRMPGHRRRRLRLQRDVRRHRLAPRAPAREAGARRRALHRLHRRIRLARRSPRPAESLR